jgi:hypothetical protein
MNCTRAATFSGLIGLATLALAFGAPSIEKPAEPQCALVLENARAPGAKVDVAMYRGKPVVLRGMCPE